MLMVKNRLNKLPAVRLGLIILWLLAWTGAGLAVDSATLPAKDWNPRQVERLQAPAGRSLTFRRPGRQPQHPEVFERVLTDMAGDPSLTFAIDIGDMVERGTLEQFDGFFKQIQPYSRMPFLTTAGNHDLGEKQDPTLYREIFGRNTIPFSSRTITLSC